MRKSKFIFIRVKKKNWILLVRLFLKTNSYSTAIDSDVLPCFLRKPELNSINHKNQIKHVVHFEPHSLNKIGSLSNKSKAICVSMTDKVQSNLDIANKKTNNDSNQQLAKETPKIKKRTFQIWP